MNEAAKQRADHLHVAVSQLEAVVAGVLERGRGGLEKELREICEDVVEHSRRKALILQHTDSSLLLAAVEQAREEIGKLPDVTATNAEVMEEVEQRTRGRGPGEDANLSTRSQGGQASLQERLAGLSSAGSSEAPSPATPGVAARPPALASEIVQPLREFAAEVAEEGKRAPGPSLRTLSMSIRRDKSSDFRKSREYDFEVAQSPMASYYMTPEDFNPFAPGASRNGGQLFAPYSMGSAPITSDYMLSSPRTRGTQSLPAGGTKGPFDASSSDEQREGRGEEEGEEEGRTGSAAEESGAAVEDEELSEPASSEGGGGPEAAAAGGASAGPGREGGAHCAAGVPPGLNPLAVVEGHSDLDNPTTPANNADLPRPGEEEEGFGDDEYRVGSATPPKHVLQQLAQGIKRLSM